MKYTSLGIYAQFNFAKHIVHVNSQNNVIAHKLQPWSKSAGAPIHYSQSLQSTILHRFRHLEAIGMLECTAI